MHYLDNAATTAVLPAVAEVADRVLRANFANPSSLYTPGLESENIIAGARKKVAVALGCVAENITFTASGTEGNNLAILGAVSARKAWGNHIVVTGFEHPSVQNCVSSLEKSGWNVSVIYPDLDGHINLAAMSEAVTSQTALVCCIHVNNEIGSVQNVEALARAVKAKNSRTAVHVDGVQAFGKLPISLAKTAIDSYAISGHKIHAPKGIGALYLRKSYHISPVLFGGMQERGFRPGTENIAYIAALGEAISLMQSDFTACRAKLAMLTGLLLAELSSMDKITINSPTDALDGIVNFSADTIRSETMLHFLEMRGVYVSSGSACSKGEASHTLTAMGFEKQRIDSAIRVSLCGESTEEDCKALLNGVRDGLQSLARAPR